MTWQFLDDDPLKERGAPLGRFHIFLSQQCLSIFFMVFKREILGNKTLATIPFDEVTSPRQLCRQRVWQTLHSPSKDSCIRENVVVPTFICRSSLSLTSSCISYLNVLARVSHRWLQMIWSEINGWVGFFLFWNGLSQVGLWVCFEQASQVNHTYKIDHSDWVNDLSI